VYEQGRGVTQDDEKAAFWFRKAAEQGDAEAQYTLGYMYANGDGVPRDYQQSLFWFRNAAEQGDVAAQFKVAQLNLGPAYTPDNTVTQDFIEAYKWFSIASVDGDQHAKEGLETTEPYLTASAIEEAVRRANEWVASYQLKKSEKA
jgi:TPR repeat protein